jgi:hypothetical protein
VVTGGVLSEVADMGGWPKCRGFDLRLESLCGAKAKRKQMSIEQAAEHAEKHRVKRHRTDQFGENSIDPNQFEYLYIKAITSYNLSLRLVKCKEFKDLLTFLNNDCDQ